MEKETGGTFTNDVVGVIPAAGYARRISPIPCSKEIYPVAFPANNGQNNNGPKVIATYLLENMHRAGVEKAYMIIRKGKWDIPQYFGTGDSKQPKLAYLSIGPTAGAPFTVDEVYPFTEGKTVVFGFPDIMIKPDTVFQSLLKRKTETKADIVLALFKVNDASKADMVQVGEGSRVLGLEIKPYNTTLIYAWMAAVWSPYFTEFMHALLKKKYDNLNEELYVGNVIQQALRQELSVQSVIFDEGDYLDIGTREGLSAVNRWIERNEDF